MAHPANESAPVTSGGTLPNLKEVGAQPTSAPPDLVIANAGAGYYTVDGRCPEVLALFKRITWSRDRRWVHRAHRWLVRDNSDFRAFLAAVRERGYRVEEVPHGRG